MKLYEYQSKALLRKYGIPVANGQVTSVARTAKQIAEHFASPVVVKAQVLAEGRGVAGGIRLAKTPTDAEIIAGEILSGQIKGLPCRKVIVEEALSIEQEYFILLTFDRGKKLPVLLIYQANDIYIETVANALPDAIDSMVIDPLIGLQRYQVRDLALQIDFPMKYVHQLVNICVDLWRLFIDTDARIAAISPLTITTDGRLLAMDAKISLDPCAAFRQEIFMDFRDPDQEDEREYEGRKYGLDYVKMSGNIGCLVNGAGYALATTDEIYACGGIPANFLDLGTGVNSQKFAAALEIFKKDSDVKVILINIFGGMVSCKTVVKSLLAALEKCWIDTPMVLSLDGNKSEEACEMIRTHPRFILCRTMSDAIQKAVDMANEIERMAL